MGVPLSRQRLRVVRGDWSAACAVTVRMPPTNIPTQFPADGEIKGHPTSSAIAGRKTTLNPRLITYACGNKSAPTRRDASSSTGSQAHSWTQTEAARRPNEACDGHWQGKGRRPDLPIISAESSRAPLQEAVVPEQRPTSPEPAVSSLDMHAVIKALQLFPTN